MTRTITESLHLDRAPAWLRNTLDSHVFWLVVFGLAVSGLAIWAYINTQSIANAQARQTRDEAIKAAQIQSSAQSAYQSCIQSRPELRRLSLHVAGVNEMAETLVENSRAVAESTPTYDPQYAVRVANLHRLERAARKIAAIKSLPAPSLAECRARRTTILNTP